MSDRQELGARCHQVTNGVSNISGVVVTWFRPVGGTWALREGNIA
jgi:hypothetical protein